jgi:cytochrome oxidase Cu insertion factor (SCO1/SenC/PrrC family)
VFFAPLIIAFALYYGVEGWRPSGQTNHGELVQPPQPLPEIDLASGNALPLAASVFKGKWTLVYVGAGECDARCREALTLMRQTRLALNDDLPRVQRVFLVTQACCDTPYLQTEHEGLLVGLLEGEGGAQFREVFQAAVPEPIDQAGRIYIVDPLGNLMMSYPRNSEPKGLLIDMKKLLKLSHIG